MLPALLLLAPSAAGQPPKPAAVPPSTLEPGLTVSVRLDALLAADPLKGLRAAAETDTPVFTEEVQRDYAAKPLDFVRLTRVQFVSVPAGQYPLELPVVVRTLHRPVDEAAFRAAVGGSVVTERGKLTGLPDVQLIRGRSRTHGVVGDQIITIESQIIDRPPDALCARLFAEALKQDAEAAKGTAVAVARWDGRVAKRAMPGPEQAKLAQPLRALFAADAGLLTVHLTPGGTVRGQTRTPAVAVRAVGTFPDEATAVAAGPAVKEVLAMADGLLKVAKLRAAQDVGDGWQPVFGLADATLKSATVGVDGKTATAEAKADITPAVAAALAGLPKRTDEAVARTRSSNNLKQIGLAFHNHESATNALPTDIYSKDGKPLLSWRVQILQYLGHDRLYNQFKLDEPWDSEHNRKLLPLMPRVYQLPGAKAEPGRTFYQSFVGKRRVTPQPLLVEGGLKRTIVSITDGTSNTLLAAEAAEAVEWTKPADLPFDPKGKLPKLGGHFPRGFHAVLCDGSVRFMPSDMPDATLRAAITTDGGEVTPQP